MEPGLDHLEGFVVRFTILKAVLTKFSSPLVHLLDAHRS
jgi:hypothetical protein